MHSAPHTVPPALGEFRISAVLGRGGSGVVYDATWGPRRVALKVLHEELAGTQRVRSQFLSEARALQGISHPSVVKVLGVGELPDGRPFLAMEHLAGETLASVLARGPLPLAAALELFDELCEAVGALHAGGLVHRDLKPENVFVVATAHAVLLDLGIAKELAAPSSTTTMEGGVRGTPAYMAPERFFGQPAGVATDIYELAVTLYAMLAAKLPWEDAADPEARLSPRPLVDLVAHVPAELDVEIRRALSTRAQNRPASAAAFRDGVRAAVDGANAPSPGSTARMKPHGPAAETESYFADRQAETDRGRTPLAWAPAEAPQVPAPPPPQRRWPVVAAGIAVAAAGGGVAWWRLARSQPAVSAAASTGSAVVDDPWAVTPQASDRQPEPEKTIAAAGAALAPGEARKRIANAVARVPADTRVLFTLDVGELRRDAQFDAILGKLADHLQVKALLATAPCLRPILAGSDWVVFATQSLQEPDRGTLIVGGRWQRADVVACLADDMVELEMPDESTMLQLRRVGWVDFLDDHTVYISVREDLAAAQVHALVKHGAGGGTARLKALATKLPAERTGAGIVDGGGDQPWPSDALPAGSDLATSFKVAPDGWTTVDVAIHAPDANAAGALARAIHAQIDPVFADADARRAGTITVTRDKAIVRIKGSLSPFIIGMIPSAVP